MKANPELLDSLYAKQRKNFPDQLPFPERFNLKLDEESFNKGKVRDRKQEIQKIVDWQGNPISEKRVTIIKYEGPSRLDEAIRNSFSKTFNPFSHIYSELYDNIQIGTFNKDLRLEYNLSLHPVDIRVKTILVAYDTREIYAKSFYGDTLKVRIQYAERYVNSAGVRFECYGYIYLPKRKSQ